MKRRELSLSETLPPPLPLGTRTPWGPIRAVSLIARERYYFMSKERGDVSMMPARVVEWLVAAPPTREAP